MSSTHKLALLSATICALGATVALAQAPATAPAPLPTSPPEDTLFFVQNVAPLPAFGAQIDVLGPAGSVMGPVVTGKPYSARSITESTQTLADGNRIVQRNEATIYRDSEGRIRREQTLGGVGPWQTGEPVTIINIHDPVADKSYMLDPIARIARDVRPFRMSIANAEGIEAAKAGGETASLEVRTIVNGQGPVPAPVPGAQFTPAARGTVTMVRQAEIGGGVRVFGGAVAAPLSTDIHAAMGAYEPAEDLGEQVLEGLLVQGTRMKDTIPAGVLGNERPIEIVTERWYSKDIEAMVLQRFFDPRFGETLYQLVNVVRGDPSPALFQVPQDYETVDEGARTGIRGVPGQRVEFELRREPPP